MINILHSVAALLFALLLELFAGNWYVVIPFCCCVLNRITAKFALPWVFFCGFLSGLILDLIYWRIYPGSALATGFTLLAVRILTDRSKIRQPLFRALFQGLLTGLLAVILMALFNGYANNRRFPDKYHLFTSLCGAVVVQLLIFPRSSTGNEAPERAVPQGRNQESEGNGRSGRKGNSTGSGKSRSGKKK